MTLWKAPAGTRARAHRAERLGRAGAGAAMVRVSLLSARDGTTSYLNDVGVPFSVNDFAPAASLLQNSTRARLAEACVSPRTAATAWSLARRRSRRLLKLSVGVLGCSTTAGCGALSPTARCSMPLSWGRHAHDALTEALRGRKIEVETNIYQKNAVEASFFFDCTHQLLPKRPDIVILEVLQNMYSLNFSSSLNQTVMAIRRVQPHAAIVFAVWLKVHMLRPSVLQELREFAEASGVDLADAPAAMSILGLRTGELYARQHGQLDHHPNALGHEMLGALTARCIAQRLETNRVEEGDSGLEPGIGRSSSNMGSSADLLEAAGAGADVKYSTPEMCYSSADEIPISSQNGFALQDDGVHKGVKKLGYSSTHVGDKLTIGPINLQTQASGTPAGSGTKQWSWCYSNIRVRLGYLVSTSPGMGELYIACTGGCGCRPVKSSLLRKVLPFPRLDANARRIAEWGLNSNETVTMTAHTVFIAYMHNVSALGAAKFNRETACYLNLHHRKATHPNAETSNNASRVRVDSIALLVHGDPTLVVPCVHAKPGNGA